LRFLTVTEPGTYFIEAKNSTGGTDRDTIELINPVGQLQILGLNSNYCDQSQSINIFGLPTGGVFSGAGISNNNFNPSIAGVGNHTIEYLYTDSSGCSKIDSVQVSVYNSSQVSFSGLPQSCCSNDSAFVLSGIPAGGFFTGNGITNNTFNPANTSTGNNIVSYNYTDSSNCIITSSQNILVKAKRFKFKLSSKN